jgi:hypothetical protein
MVTVTTEYGEFAADSLDEATKVAKQAERAAKREAKRREAALVVARERACAVGYNVYYWLAEKGKMPCGWTFYDTGNKYGPRVDVPSETPWNSVVTLETEWGTGTVELFTKYNRPIGHVWNGAGFTQLLVLADDSRPEDSPAVYAIGCHDGVLSLQPMPKIFVDMFRQSANNEAA